MLKKSLILIFIGLICFVSGCSEVAVTGRQQFNIVPDSMVNQMALDSYQQFLGEAKLSADKEKTAMVERVANNVTNAVNKYGKVIGINTSDYNWEVKLVESEEVNAWCMPGGKIVVYTGILELADTDDKLAIVLGHEVAHAIARHGSERMSQQIAVTGAAWLTSEQMKEESEEKQKLVMTVFAAGAQYGFLLPYSRKHEFEADEIGLLFSTLAGYDPGVSVEFWQSMVEKSGDNSMDFFSTHPAGSKRIEKLQMLIPQVRQKAEFIKKG